MSHASRCLPAFLAAAHLFFIANASRFRPASLTLPRRERDGTATRFGVPAWAALFAAQRRLVASMIRLRPSGLKCLFFVLPSAPSGPVAGEPVISRSADMARSMADRCFSSLEMIEMIFSTSFHSVSLFVKRIDTHTPVRGRTHLRFSSYDMIKAHVPLHPPHNS